MDDAGAERPGSCLPLAGQVLFASVRRKRIDEGELQRNIQSLGGKLETFFSNEITCVLTDELPVPERPDDKLPERPDSKLLKRSQNGKLLVSEAKRSNIIDKAKSLGIQIMRIESFLTWLKATVIVPPKEVKVSKPNSVSKLNGCFMKFENNSRNYSPVYKVYPDEPKMEFETLYYEPIAYEEKPSFTSISSEDLSQFSVDIKLPKLLEIGSNQQQDKSLSSSKNDSSKTIKVRRQYCECCKMYFTCLKNHLRGPKHSKYVSNLENFKELTALTNEIASVAELREKLCNVSGDIKEIKTEHQNLSVRGPISEQTELEQKLADTFKCNDLISIDNLNEFIKVENFSTSDIEENELDRIFSQTYKCVTDEIQINESMTEKGMIKEELNFNDCFPSDILPDNDRLFSSDISDNESIQANVYNIIKNVFDEDGDVLSNSAKVCHDKIDSDVLNLSNILNHDLLSRTLDISNSSKTEEQVLKKLCLDTWTIRPISDIKMLFVRCSVLSEELPRDSWTVKNVKDTKLVLSRSRFGITKLAA